MSRMTKFLKQTCIVTPYFEREDGAVETNRFGEIIYQESIECKCRNEKFVRDIESTAGRILKTSSRYFFDESLDIKVNYLVDNKVVLSVESYINSLGLVEGYEVYV